MRHRFATHDDVPILAHMNRQLVEDEGHRNRFKPASWFEDRMRGFLTSGYRAVLIEIAGETVAYAVYVDHPDHSDTIYLRQIFVHRTHRRQRIGREAMPILMQEVWPRTNDSPLKFWSATQPPWPSTRPSDSAHTRST